MSVRNIIFLSLLKSDILLKKNNSILILCNYKGGVVQTYSNYNPYFICVIIKVQWLKHIQNIIPILFV